MHITIEIARNIDAIKEHWDHQLPEQHHLRSKHLSAFEQSKIDDIDVYYIQIFLKKKPIGVAYVQCFWFKPTHLNFNRYNSFTSSIIKFLLPKKLPIVVCGNLFRIGFQGFYFSNEMHHSVIFDALELFSKEATKGCVVAIKDCSTAFMEQLYTRYKYLFFGSDVTMELARKPHWLSFDDYLKNLSKKYAKRAKKIIAAFAGIEAKQLSADDILTHGQNIEKLYWSIVEKQSVKLGTVNAAYFYELKKDLGENFEFHALFHKDEMVGFYTYIFYENEMETHYIGLNYTYNSKHQLYFNILFLSVQKMIELKFSKVELGRTAKEAKANLGACPRQVFNYVKVNNILPKLALRYFLKRFNQTENNKQLERNPFHEKISG